jgi:ABC-type multidrug transport system fused ATPase/permease subunit
MMVYQPGGYVYNDFLFLGSPMQLVLWIVSVALLVFTTGSNFYISWFVSFLILVLVAFYGIAMEYFKNKIQSRRNDVPTEV